MTQPVARGPISFRVEQDDVTTHSCDVVILKHAQAFYGADLAVAKRLTEVGVPQGTLQVPDRQCRYVATRGAITAPAAVFVGTPSLRHFTYSDIRDLVRIALEFLWLERQAVEHVAVTLHGPGFGLDEYEAAYAEIVGVHDAVKSGRIPETLRRISLVDLNRDRVARLRSTLPQLVAGIDGITSTSFGDFEIATPAPPTGPTSRAVQPAAEDSVGHEPGQAPHIFVAMPYDPAMRATFHYGIQKPILDTGYLAERCDQAAFTGDVLRRIREKITSAALVIADLSHDNPNVYLEVGYAWGREIPTLLIATTNKALCFDVQGHRCLYYDDIVDLEEKLRKEITELEGNGTIVRVPDRTRTGGPRV